jgi:hypothetical protein
MFLKINNKYQIFKEISVFIKILIFLSYSSLLLVLYLIQLKLFYVYILYIICRGCIELYLIKKLSFKQT